MASPGYLRFPHLSGDLLTFVAQDDVWLAPVTGGRAWRLSADQCAGASPRLSPDGSLVAWTSIGDSEVYCAPADGGPASRRSYWTDGTTQVLGWSPAGQILARTAAGQAFRHQTWAYTLPPAPQDGGFAGRSRLPFGPVAGLAMNGAAIALLNGTDGRDPAAWKRYRGGRAGRLWVRAEAGSATCSRTGAGAGNPDGQAAATAPPFTRLLAAVAGQFASPMLVSGRLAFLSDHEGTGNVYSCGLDGSDLHRHTDHDGSYARNASTDGSRVVYQCGGDVWLLDGLAPDSEFVQLDISLAAPSRASVPQLISADDHLRDLSCDAAGQASAIAVRGTVHWLTHRDGPARALSVRPGTVARLPRVLGGTGQVVWVTDADGSDALDIAPDGTSRGPDQPARRIATGELGWVADMSASPDGSRVAVAARDGRLLIIEVGPAAVTELARSDNGPVTGLTWSPDSAWLAWSQPGPDPLRRVRLARLADGEVTDVTDGRFTDSSPAFTLDGTFLAFLSAREFDPVYDAHVFDLSFPFGCRPYLLPLAAATPSPFGPLLGGRPVADKKDDAANGDSGAAPDNDARPDGNSGGSAAIGRPANGTADLAGGKQPDLTVDLAGLPGRVVQVPVPESRYSSLRAVQGGLAWLREPVTGMLGDSPARVDDDRPRAALQHFDIGRATVTDLADEVDWFVPSGDGARLVVRDGGDLCVVPASRKPDKDNAADKVSVDLTRARFLTEPAALWQAAYRQAGQAMRHDFWVADMGDVAWDAALDAYRPLLDRIATPADFADVLLEAVGELGTSHTYVVPASRPGSDLPAAGLLGADLEPGPDGWRIARLLPGESSDRRARSPLAAPGVRLSAGDFLLAVDGQPVDPSTGPGPLLVGAAGKPVELTVGPAAGGEPHRAVVIPLRDERRLRYQDWVTGRRARVRETGQGRLGYLHVPDMVSQGWADFHRDLHGELAFDGLIVDIRCNRGGHTSQLVLEKLARRIIGWDISRHGLPISYPVDAPRGPVVTVADENAASDGDIIAAAIRALRLGPVVGARTWGGVIGIAGWHELVDGTHMTMPTAAFWFSQFGWDVENYGVDPDVEVIQTPDDSAAGRDPQLDTAVQVCLQALADQPPATPPGTADRPSRSRPPLPPRG